MSKYDALRDHLRTRVGEVRYSLGEVSRIVPGGLPRSAFAWQAWWTNADRTHSHCRSWGDAGCTAHPDLAQQVVRFQPTSASRNPSSGGAPEVLGSPRAQHDVQP